MKAQIRTYKPLQKQVFSIGDYSIVPIRDKDKYNIMKWRNEQMYHLRQNEIITQKKQEKYFKETISGLFKEEKPEQMLFSYLKKDKCIGYGGLVHINWEQKTAELSFIMNTELEKDEFEKHWLTFIHLIEKIAFQELKFNSIFTYAFNLRPHLYQVLEKTGFVLEHIIPNKIKINDKPIDVYIHTKNTPDIYFKDANINDIKLLYDWANDEMVRKQSFNSRKINYKEHKEWFNNKLNDKNNIIWIAESKGKSIGLIRFDIQDNYAVISVSIDKNFRGKGFGSKILKLASQKFINLFNVPIYAYIKKDNIASIRSFEKAGYIFEENKVINNVNSVLYIKK